MNTQPVHHACDASSSVPSEDAPPTGEPAASPRDAASADPTSEARSVSPEPPAAPAKAAKSSLDMPRRYVTWDESDIAALAQRMAQLWLASPHEQPLRLMHAAQEVLAADKRRHAVRCWNVVAAKLQGPFDAAKASIGRHDSLQPAAPQASAPTIAAALRADSLGQPALSPAAVTPNAGATPAPVADLDALLQDPRLRKLIDDLVRERVEREAPAIVNRILAERRAKDSSLRSDDDGSPLSFASSSVPHQVLVVGATARELSAYRKVAGDDFKVVPMNAAMLARPDLSREYFAAVVPEGFDDDESDNLRQLGLTVVDHSGSVERLIGRLRDLRDQPSAH